MENSRITDENAQLYWETGECAWNTYRPVSKPSRSSNTVNTHADHKTCRDASRITGHFLESESNLGLYHSQARLYDPEIHRFYGVNAMRGDYPTINSYQYALNNPMIYKDPSGMYVVSSDGTYVTRVQRGYAKLISGLQSIPGVGAFATLTKWGETAGDPSINMNASDWLNLATVGVSGTMGAIYRRARNISKMERTTLRTMNGSKEAGATALGFAFNDEASLFIDEQIFNKATKLGQGQANIANRGFFSVSDGAKDLAEDEGIDLYNYVNSRFNDIESDVIKLAYDSGFNLNNEHERELFNIKLRNMSQE